MKNYSFGSDFRISATEGQQMKDNKVEKNHFILNTGNRRPYNQQ
tara:strand:- start:637 stop:768 length:132 start_codon:yes stop_codon:yes gene_type:complete